MTRTKSILRVAIAGSLIVALVPMAHGFALRGGVLGNGATPASGVASSGKRLFATAGQPAVGVSLGPSHKVSHGFWSFGGSRVIAVEDPIGNRLPERLELGAPYPNPTSGVMRLRLALPRASHVTATFHDIQGRAVAAVVDRDLPAGFHALEWRSASLVTGVYFARVQVDGASLGTRRFVVVR
jgi:hypothetical protein